MSIEKHYKTPLAWQNLRKTLIDWKNTIVWIYSFVRSNSSTKHTKKNAVSEVLHHIKLCDT